jgi:hypothetical protein
MRTCLKKRNFGLVLQLNAPNRTDCGPLSAQLIANSSFVSDDGNICLLPAGGLEDVLDGIDGLKRELDELANETILWFAKTITLRRTRLAIVAGLDATQSYEVIANVHPFPNVRNGAYLAANSKVNGV